jgi:hypothetical protein
VFDEIDEDTLPGVVGPVPTDYNNVQEDGTLVVSKRRLQKVVEGTTVIIEDPDDDTRYPATVVQVEDRKVTLEVDWTSPIEVVDPEVDVW